MLYVIVAFLLSLPLVQPALAQGLFGPGKFRIDQSDDRFSSNGLTTRQGFNNRVTKKTAGGGIYLDWKGLYLDPIAIKERTTGKLTFIGFVLHHETEESGIGVVNTIGTPRRISFLFPDQRLIQLEVKGGEQQIGRTGNYDRLTRTVGTAVSEVGTVETSPDDMKALATASSVTIHLEGQERSWTIEAKDVSKTFVENVAAFYAQEIAPNLAAGR